MEYFHNSLLKIKKNFAQILRCPEVNIPAINNALFLVCVHLIFSLRPGANLYPETYFFLVYISIIK